RQRRPDRAAPALRHRAHRHLAAVVEGDAGEPAHAADGRV
ncbi:MAG: hypothetical protein AVDCRST_MAG40-2058, partial [uncultured Gemmatimonadaceae bacterium]